MSNTIITEGNRERTMLDSLTDRVIRLCKREESKLLTAGTQKDQFGLYAYDFVLSNPISDFPLQVFRMMLEKMLGATVNQKRLENGQAKIRILV